MDGTFVSVTVDCSRRRFRGNIGSIPCRFYVAALFLFFDSRVHGRSSALTVFYL